MENLHNKREIYNKNHLLESEINKNPIKQFSEWFHLADHTPEIREANAMSLSTLEEDQCPRTRMVLLKEFSDEGFVFFTNYESKKGKALTLHPKACLHFFWPVLERQVIIKATLEKISPEDSTQYFHERPKGSQLGALASHQSSIIPNREFLEEKLNTLKDEYEKKEIQRPSYWGGYLARPYEIEFWQGRPNRLHDRIIYEKTPSGNWDIFRLSP